MPYPRGEPPRTVAFGVLGKVLDDGHNEGRWRRWRPTISLVSQPNLPVDHLVLLVHAGDERLATRITLDIAEVSPRTEVEQVRLDVTDPWDFPSVYTFLFDLARGRRFDPARERYLVHLTTGTHVEQICLFLLTEARYLPALVAQSSPGKRGTADLARGHVALIDLDVTKLDHVVARRRLEQADARTFLKNGIPTRNAAFNQLIEEIEHVALASRAPLLLGGPTGAGKSQLARRVAELRRQRNKVTGPLVEVNCATLRGDHAMSALFGHVRGAFTGAERARTGLLALADGGTLFLDEIGELGLDEQAMLLHALEEKTFRPVGSERYESSDFALIAGTNRALEAEVRAGNFREDLLARISLWSYTLPGLAQRLEDLEPNLDFELERASGLLGTSITLLPDARRRFLRFATGPGAAWPGNFRELHGTVLRMATLAKGGRIGVAEVEREKARLEAAWASRAGPEREPASLVERAMEAPELEGLDRFERVQLEEVLSVCREASSLAEAGRILFAASRQKRARTNDSDRLRKYLLRYGLSFDTLPGRPATGA